MNIVLYNQTLLLFILSLYMLESCLLIAVILVTLKIAFKVNDNLSVDSRYSTIAFFNDFSNPSISVSNSFVCEGFFELIEKLEDKKVLTENENDN